MPGVRDQEVPLWLPGVQPSSAAQLAAGVGAFPTALPSSTCPPGGLDPALRPLTGAVPPSPRGQPIVLGGELNTTRRRVRESEAAAPLDLAADVHCLGNLPGELRTGETSQPPRGGQEPIWFSHVEKAPGDADAWTDQTGGGRVPESAVRGGYSGCVVSGGGETTADRGPRRNSNNTRWLRCRHIFDLLRRLRSYRMDRLRTGWKAAPRPPDDDPWVRAD